MLSVAGRTQTLCSICGAAASQPNTYPASQPLLTNQTIAAVVCCTLLQITAFERSGFLVDLATVPSSMTCPGSKAREFFSCYAHPAPGGARISRLWRIHMWWHYSLQHAPHICELQGAASGPHQVFPVDIMTDMRRSSGRPGDAP
jgi:hypothetical protein